MARVEELVSGATLRWCSGNPSLEVEDDYYVHESLCMKCVMSINIVLP